MSYLMRKIQFNRVDGVSEVELFDKDTLLISPLVLTRANEGLISNILNKDFVGVQGLCVSDLAFDWIKSTYGIKELK